MQINNAQELKVAIEKLELRKKIQEEELVAQFHSTIENLKPANLIKSAIGNIQPSAVVGTVLKTAGSIGLGLLSNKLMGGSVAASTGKKILSSLLNRTATETVANNAGTIKAYGRAIIHNLFSKKKSS